MIFSDYSKIEAGRLELQQEPMKMMGIAADVESTFRGKPNKKGSDSNWPLILRFQPWWRRWHPIKTGSEQSSRQRNQVHWAWPCHAFTSLRRNHRTWAKSYRVRFEVKDSGIGIAEDKNNNRCLISSNKPTAALLYLWRYRAWFNDMRQNRYLTGQQAWAH